MDGARRRAGLEHAARHELRHTCPTRSREAELALEAVQAQAGRQSIESTRLCLHLASDWLAGEYLRAAALIDADTSAPARCSPCRRWLPDHDDFWPAVSRLRPGLPVHGRENSPRDTHVDFTTSARRHVLLDHE